MSIQEASQLIQCGALGRDGEIFLLEMGKPIRIVQMAKDLIDSLAMNLMLICNCFYWFKTW